MVTYYGCIVDKGSPLNHNVAHAVSECIIFGVDLALLSAGRAAAQTVCSGDQ